MIFKSFDVSGHAAGPIDLPGFGTIFLVTSDNNQRGAPFTPIAGLIMHWTGLSLDTPIPRIWMTVFAAYHWGIVFNGHEAAIIRTLRPTEKGAHLWGRNTSNAGAAYAATADSSKPKYGPGAPPEPMRWAMQTLGGEFCAWHKLDPRGHRQVEKKQRLGAGTPNDRLVTVPGFVSPPVVASHQTFAALDQYADERWDTGALLAEDQVEIARVCDELHAGTRTFTLEHLL